MSATLTVLRQRLADAAMASAEADAALRCMLHTPPGCSDPVAYALGFAVTADRKNREVFRVIAEIRAILSQDVMEFKLSHSAHCLSPNESKNFPRVAENEAHGGSAS